MSSPESSICPRCGTSVAGLAPGNPCPACLLSEALGEDPDAPETVAMPGGERRPLPDTSSPEFPSVYGAYRLLGLLGRGGMGAVYEAEDLTTGRRVALKTLGRQLDSPEARQRFLREGRLAARVNHPHSLYVFGSEEVEGHPVITMEIAEAGTLQDALKRRGPFAPTKAVDAILNVIDGLEAAAAAGVLHRDIKPSNCFVCPDGSVKVGDFGLSVSTFDQADTFATAQGMILGTPSYASPEQLRGDEVDVRTDIYSVGATLFTLLTNQAPFVGANAVQVVANVINQKPKPVSELRSEVPAGLDAVIARCLAKEPNERFPDYAALRKALLPFSSSEPEPASMKSRVLAGWIDYLLAFLVPYLTLMLTVGTSAFHLQPLVQRSLASAKYYLLFLAFGVLYFTLTEGLWGAGLGKRLRGLRVVRSDGAPPGIGRAFLRILIPVFAIEGVRIPLLLTAIPSPNINAFSSAESLAYIGITNVCAWIPVLLTRGMRRENGFATVWDRLSGTRVIVEASGVTRREASTDGAPTDTALREEVMGPFRVVQELIPGEWILATDPVLRRHVWLLRADTDELPAARRHLARAGRLRWLQTVRTEPTRWNAFEAPAGAALSTLVRDERRLPWSRLRHWLHDLASELWAASGDGTLPPALGLDHVWITNEGRAVILETPWPRTDPRSMELIPVHDLAGQQRFLQAVASLVDPASLPLHARPVLQNLAEGRFERLSFLAGTLRGLLDRPTDVGRGLRAGSLFMLPVYVWFLVFVGYRDAWNDLADQVTSVWAGVVMLPTLAVLGSIALIQLFEIPFRSTASHAIFRLAVVGPDGSRAGPGRSLARWAAIWLPLGLPLTVLAQVADAASPTTAGLAFATIALWLGMVAFTLVHPNRGLHDRLAGTRVIRQ